MEDNIMQHHTFRRIHEGKLTESSPTDNSFGVSAMIITWLEDGDVHR
jgi:hypothetical protein